MLIVNNEQMYQNNRIFAYIPQKFRRFLYYINMEGLEEIRLRQGRPLALYYSDAAFFLSERGRLTENPRNPLLATKADLQEGLELICEGSVYAAEHEIRNGYVTIHGGHRVGLAGTAVLTSESITNIKNISGLNYRIAREIQGIADKLMPEIFKNGSVENTLIISPPQCGKTTLLRDIIRNISNRGIKVGVADVRNEIAAMTNGYPGFDLGYACDVLDGAPKKTAIDILLRSMSPTVIATDELGGKTDAETVKKAMYAGVKVLATVHSENRQTLAKRDDVGELLEHFSCIITLSRENGVGTVSEVFHAV